MRPIPCVKRNFLRPFLFIFTFIFVSLSYQSPSVARPGDLDLNFGEGNGIVRQNLALTCVDRPCNNITNLPSIYKTSQGKYLISGYAYVAFDRSRDTTSYLARLNADGSLDERFGSFGIIQEMNPNMQGFIIKPLSDGKILKGGTAFLQRLNSDGSIDTSFGIHGMAEGLGSASGVGSSAEGAVLAVQADGKILMTVHLYVSVDGRGEFQSYISRYLPTGFLDRSFGNSGRINFPIDRSVASTHINGSRTPNVGELIPLPDGRLLVSAYPNRSIQIGVYDTQGRLDTNFARSSSTPGILQETRGAENMSSIFSVLQGTGITPEGKILKAMNIYSSVSNANQPGRYTIITSLGLFRYNADGTPDNSFGTNGFLVMRNVDYIGEALKLLPNGKILIAAETKGLGEEIPFQPSFGNSHYTLLSFNSDGSPNNDFGINGRVETPIRSHDLFKSWVLEEQRGGFFQPDLHDCKITLLGTSTERSDEGRFGGAPTHNETILLRYDLENCGDGSSPTIIQNIPTILYHLPIQLDYFKPRPIDPPAKIQTENNLNQK